MFYSVVFHAPILGYELRDKIEEAVWMLTESLQGCISIIESSGYGTYVSIVPEQQGGG